MPAGTSIVDTLLAGSSSGAASLAKTAQRPKPLNPGPVAAGGMSGGHRSPTSAGGRQAKLFIGGISRHTTTKQLRDHFMKYGRVIDCVAMKEADGRSRGFGYVTFSSQAACDRVLSEPQNIDGRIVDVKRAVPEGLGGAPRQESSFLGGPMASDLSMSGSDALWQGYHSLGDASNPWASTWADYSMGTCALDDFAAMSAFGMAGRARQPDCLELLSSGGPLSLPPTPTTARQHLQQQGSLVLGTTPPAASGEGKCMSAEAAEFVPQQEPKQKTQKAAAAPASKPRKVLGEISTENSANIMKADKDADEDFAKKPMFIKVSQPLDEKTQESTLPLPSSGVQTGAEVSKLGVLTTFEDVFNDKDTESESEKQAPEAAKVSEEELEKLGSIPSMGSILHEAGECKRCNFFAKGRCENGKACQFCHYPHEKRKASRQEKRQRERQQTHHLNIETEFDDDFSTCMGSSRQDDSGFLGLPPVLTSQPGSVSSAYSSLLSPCLSAAGVARIGAMPVAAGPPGLVGPAPVLPAWQPEEELNPALISAIADAIAQQAISSGAPPAATCPSSAPAPLAAFLSTAPPSVSNPLATPAMMSSAEAVDACKADDVVATELPEGDAENVWSREDMLRVMAALEATGAVKPKQPDDPPARVA